MGEQSAAELGIQPTEEIKLKPHTPYPLEVPSIVTLGNTEVVIAPSKIMVKKDAKNPQSESIATYRALIDEGGKIRPVSHGIIGNGPKSDINLDGPNMADVHLKISSGFKGVSLQEMGTVVGTTVRKITELPATPTTIDSRNSSQPFLMSETPLTLTTGDGSFRINNSPNGAITISATNGPVWELSAPGEGPQRVFLPDGQEIISVRRVGDAVFVENATGHPVQLSKVINQEAITDPLNRIKAAADVQKVIEQAERKVDEPFSVASHVIGKNEYSNRYKNSTNDDRVTALKERKAIGVYDGMGGHGSGDVAAQIIKEETENSINAVENPTFEQFQENISRACAQASLRIEQQIEQNNLDHNMGTTLTIGQVIDDGRGLELALANIGDSRMYMVLERDDGTLYLKQLTKDDNLLNAYHSEEQANEIRSRFNAAEYASELSAADQKLWKNQNIITDALKADSHNPQFSRHRIPSNAVMFLAMSDGIHENHIDTEIAAKLTEQVREGMTLAEIITQQAEFAKARAISREVQNPPLLWSKIDDLGISGMALKEPILLSEYFRREVAITQTAA